MRENPRFELRERLGAGGMGVVYQAHDLERGHEVAIKTLERAEGDALYRFKTEFRALADISHRNLVTLYDMFVEPELCFFTMELVAGKSFVDHCRAANNERRSDSQLSWNEETARLDPTAEVALPCDEERLRAALPQLAAGLSSLHSAGWLHRDIKASNILVDRRGRVVILDFGLATDFAGQGCATPAGHMVGTVEYMAPEQAFPDGPLTPAADWYGVGTMIYEVLTGRLPFEGSSSRILTDKKGSDPVPPHMLVPSVAEDLDALCMNLLSRTPARRPDGNDICQRLGADYIPGTRSGSIRTTLRQPLTFAGRDQELATLEAALAETAAGTGRVMIVRGPSGIGKTELVREFESRAQRRFPDLVTLHGRCYQSEAIPYSAIDPVVDDLSRLWTELSDEEAATLVPLGGAALVRLFPVLARVPALLLTRDRLAILDPQEVRRRGTEALGETLARIGDRHPLVVFLDDMQWVDRDTLHLIRELASGPDRPAVLFLLAYRDDAAVTGRRVDSQLGVDAEVVEVGPLSAAEAATLATHVLGDSDDYLAERLARESAGVPMFVVELAEHARTNRASTVAAVTLGEVIAERVRMQTRATKHLLEIVAVAAEPITLATLAKSGGIDAASFHKAVQSLQIGRLARTSGARPEDSIEPYHDRIRETVIAGLDADATRRHHLDIARTLERGGESTPERLAHHWLGAGDDERGTIFTLKAARHAFDRLDFARAAELYESALAIGHLDQSEANQLQGVVAAAFANAGRPHDAAEAFHRAAANADAAERLDLERRSAEQLLRGGYIEEGLATLVRVLAEMGLSFPRQRWRAILSLLWGRLRLRLRGLDFRPRDPSQIAAESLGRVDVYASLGSSMSIVDPLIGANFQLRALRLALSLGERRRLARSLALQSLFHSAEGAARRASRLIDAALDVAKDDPFSAGYTLLAQASYAYFIDNAWDRCVRRVAKLEQAFHRAYASAGWEIDSARSYTCFSLMYQGKLATLCRTADRFLSDAEHRGARYTLVNLRVRLALRYLVDDQPDEAAEDVAEAIASWPPVEQGFQVQHFYALHSRGEIALYRGQPEVAAGEFERAHRGLRASLLMRIPMVATEVLFMEARAALARAQAGDISQLARARRASRALAGKKVPLARALAALVDATLANLAGKTSASVTALRATVAQLDGLDNKLFAIAARWRLGELVGGDEGAELRNQAALSLSGEGVVEPARLVSMLAPGW